VNPCEKILIIFSEELIYNKIKENGKHLEIKVLNLRTHFLRQ
jgi:hypothetical protein